MSVLEELLSSGFHFEELDPVKHLDEIVALRSRVWNHSSTQLRDSFDLLGRHYGCFKDKEIVAASRLNFGEVQDLNYGEFIKRCVPDAIFPSAELRFLVVDERYRRIGIASVLDELRIQTARFEACHAVYGITFSRPEMLRRDGFEVLSAVSAIDHELLNGFPPLGDCFLMRKHL